MWTEPGGFQHSSPGFGSSQPDTSAKGRSRTSALVPVTIAQIYQAEQMDDAFVMENKKELNTVTLVAIVRSVKESSQRFDYKVDDLSGPLLDVRQYVDQEDDMPDDLRPKPVTENTYVRIYGNLRPFNGQRNVVAFKVNPISDMNELTNHILETMYTHMLIVAQEKKQQQVLNQSAGSHAVQAGNIHSSNYAAAGGDLTPQQRQVKAIIGNAISEEGASIQQIKESLKGISEKMLREIIEHLSNEGQIYSTIDDDHFKCTE